LAKTEKGEKRKKKCFPPQGRHVQAGTRPLPNTAGIARGKETSARKTVRGQPLYGWGTKKPHKKIQRRGSPPGNAKEKGDERRRGDTKVQKRFIKKDKRQVKGGIRLGNAKKKMKVANPHLRKVPRQETYYWRGKCGITRTRKREQKR